MNLGQILISLILLFPAQNQQETDTYIFVEDCISVYSAMHKSTMAFYSVLDETTERQDLKLAVNQYVMTIMNAQNTLLKHTKSNDETANMVSTDLRKIMNDIVGNTYQFLALLSNKDISNEEIKESAKKLKSSNDFASGFFREITFGVCGSTVDKRPANNSNKDKQFSKLSKEQRNDLNKKLIELNGKEITKGSKDKSKTSYEFSIRMIYEFINMDWVFKS